MEFPDIYAEIVNRSRPSVVSAPPVSPDRDPLSFRSLLIASYTRIQTEGIGTIRSSAGVADFQDDGLSSDDEDDEDDDLLAPIEGSIPTTPTTDAGNRDKTPTLPPRSVTGLAKFFPGKRNQSQRVDSFDSTLTTDSSASTPIPSGPITTQETKEKKRKFRRFRKAGGGEYRFNPENDVLGIVMLEIKGASNLPKLSNSMCVRSCHGLG
jgi:phosphatidylserine decarboxylase